MAREPLMISRKIARMHCSERGPAERSTARARTSSLAGRRVHGPSRGVLDLADAVGQSGTFVNEFKNFPVESVNPATERGQ